MPGPMVVYDGTHIYVWVWTVLLVGIALAIVSTLSGVQVLGDSATTVTIEATCNVVSLIGGFSITIIGCTSCIDTFDGCARGLSWVRGLRQVATGLKVVMIASSFSDSIMLPDISSALMYCAVMFGWSVREGFRLCAR
eukprot:PhF_6_TR18162/c2_g1_i1/m.26958